MNLRVQFSTLICFILFLFPTQTQSQVVLYGLSKNGGIGNAGTVFSITPSGNVKIIADLKDSFASQPMGSLLYASDGNFYASSLSGGYGDSCTIFRCTPNGALKTMIQLDSVWGHSSPLGNNLIQAMDGNLYGMVTGGGTNNWGTLYKMTLSGVYSPIHFFTGYDGGYPCGSLLQTADSMFWGMTTGYLIPGHIFHCTPNGLYTSVHTFDTINGLNPYGDLLLANDGNFYGMTENGGIHGDGVLFRYTPTGTFTKLLDFDSIHGTHPYDTLIQATDGNMYGLTYQGGKGFGTLFSCTLSGNLTTIINFNDTNGANPMGTLIQASDGYLYGMTSKGGKYKYGTIFQFSLTGTIDTLVSFNGINGLSPEYGKLIEVDSLITSGVNKVAKANNILVFPNPNSGLFTIQLSGINDKASVVIYNILGEKVYSNSYQPLANSYQLDLSSNPDGLYLYRVIGESGNLIGEGKLVIQK